MKFDREQNLIKALKDTLTIDEIQAFLSYSVDEKDINLIRDTAKAALINSPNIAMNCAAMSAIWAAMIQDHSKIPVSAICGNLMWNNKTIFMCNETIPSVSVNKEWDGHCWIEFGGLVADISIFRTINNVPKLMDFKNFMERTFGTGKGMICVKPEKLSSLGLIYQPIYSLTKLQIDGLINGSY
jgi:hypothetical protein